jgi:ribosomal protein S18 acetylase RimI-like enzyme
MPPWKKGEPFALLRLVWGIPWFASGPAENQTRLFPVGVARGDIEERKTFHCEAVVGVRGSKDEIPGSHQANRTSVHRTVDKQAFSWVPSNHMIVLEQVNPRNALLFKATRLRALRDTPNAFGSTYEVESQLTDADWVTRAEQWRGERAVLYLAMDRGIACGLAGSLLDRDDATRAHLISMWTAPTYRQRGVGRLLVNEILAWVHLRQARTLQLMVTCNNEAAILFYQRLGFERTGRTEPYPNDPALLEYEMSRPVC